MIVRERKAYLRKPIEEKAEAFKSRAGDTKFRC